MQLTSADRLGATASQSQELAAQVACERGLRPVLYSIRDNLESVCETSRRMLS